MNDKEERWKGGKEIADVGGQKEEDEKEVKW